MNELATSLLFVCVVLIAGWCGYQLYECIVLRNLLEEIDERFEEYRQRINENNRFLVDAQLLQTLFPDYDAKLIRKAWKEIIQLGWVEEDFIDKQWIIKPDIKRT